MRHVIADLDLGDSSDIVTYPDIVTYSDMSDITTCLSSAEYQFLAQNLQ